VKAPGDGAGAGPVIYTFYSYKGGVGRSMALANVAEYLYSRGARIIIVDWDLDAPGLENYFFGTREQRADVSSQFLIDMLEEYTRRYTRARVPGIEAGNGIAPIERPASSCLNPSRKRHSGGTARPIRFPDSGHAREVAVDHLEGAANCH